MKPELDKILSEKFPLLYKNRNAGPKTIFNYGFEVGDGWYQIIYDLSVQLEALIQLQIDVEDLPCIYCFKKSKDHHGTSECKNYYPAHATAAQVKSKFGGLRFYLDYGMTQDMEDCITRAEKRAWNVCQHCGGDMIDKANHGWNARCCKSCGR